MYYHRWRSFHGNTYVNSEEEKRLGSIIENDRFDGTTYVNSKEEKRLGIFIHKKRLRGILTWIV